MAIYFRSPSKRNVKRSLYRKGFAKNAGLDSQEFVFDATDDELTINDQDYELNDFNGARSRISSNPDNDKKITSKKDQTVPYAIQPNDSLQSLALKFGCPVSELKRVNHLINDKEFYALRDLKIPAKEYSLLSEILCSNSSTDVDTNYRERKTFHVSISHMLHEGDSKEAKSFLQEMDRDIQRIVEKTQSKQTAIEEQLNLNSQRIQPLYQDKKNYDGASWGISWCSLLVAIVILGVLAPALYGIYIVTSYAHSNETDSSQTTLHYR